jgi:uncharacterized protein YndB with AHSA1/START domain
MNNVIMKSYIIDAPIEAVWNALTDQHEIETWGAGPAVMSDKEDSEFSLWGGQIHGKNIQVDHEEVLKQEWFGGEWDTPSLVTFTFIDEGEKTRLDLTHENFPPEERRALDEGWDSDYLGPMIEHLEGQVDEL